MARTWLRLKAIQMNGLGNQMDSLSSQTDTVDDRTDNEDSHETSPVLPGKKI